MAVIPSGFFFANTIMAYHHRHRHHHHCQQWTKQYKWSSALKLYNDHKKSITVDIFHGMNEHVRAQYKQHANKQLFISKNGDIPKEWEWNPLNFIHIYVRTRVHIPWGERCKTFWQWLDLTWNCASFLVKENPPLLPSWHTRAQQEGKVKSNLQNGNMKCIVRAHWCSSKCVVHYTLTHYPPKPIFVNQVHIICYDIRSCDGSF